VPKARVPGRKVNGGSFDQSGHSGQLAPHI
jgi:hypothetical protein